MDKEVLDGILRKNVVDLVFIKKTTGTLRRMLCTKCYSLLNSNFGVNQLGFTRPVNQPKYDVASTNNIIVWDIEKGAFRTLSTPTVKILKTIDPEDFKNGYLNN